MCPSYLLQSGLTSLWRGSSHEIAAVWRDHADTVTGCTWVTDEDVYTIGHDG